MPYLTFDADAFSRAARHVIDITAAPALSGDAKGRIDSDDLAALGGHFAEALEEASRRDLIVHEIENLPLSFSDLDFSINAGTIYGYDGVPEGTFCELDLKFSPDERREQITVRAHLEVVAVDSLNAEASTPTLHTQLVGLAALYTDQINTQLGEARNAWAAIFDA